MIKCVFFFHPGYWCPVTGCDDQGLWCVLLWLTCLVDKHSSVNGAVWPPSQ
jgi:hypothetical protein